MKNNNLNKQIKGVLEDLIAPLGVFLRRHFEPTNTNWWEDIVMKSFTIDQLKNVKARKVKNISGLDLAALLKVFDFNHYSIFQSQELLPEFRNIIKEMSAIRNRWSHAGESSYPADDIFRDLLTIKKFAKEIGVDRSFLEEIDKLLAEVQKTYSTRKIIKIPIKSKERVKEQKELPLNPDIQWGKKTYDNSDCVYDNVSVAAGKTIKLIEKYKIHSCPDSYNYKKTKNFHFRAKETDNNKAYPISKIIKIPMTARGDLADLENHGLTEDEVRRIKSYMNKNPFPENDRFYILEPPIDVPNAPALSGIKTIYF
tara:strand:+ start:47 stop:982 length:936 start_codon:yes stop_codon:yes gene_type:complete